MTFVSFMYHTSQLYSQETSFCNLRTLNFSESVNHIKLHLSGNVLNVFKIVKVHSINTSLIIKIGYAAEFMKTRKQEKLFLMKDYEEIKVENYI